MLRTKQMILETNPFKVVTGPKFIIRKRVWWDWWSVVHKLVVVPKIWDGMMMRNELTTNCFPFHTINHIKTRREPNVQPISTCSWCPVELELKLKHTRLHITTFSSTLNFHAKPNPKPCPSLFFFFLWRKIICIYFNKPEDLQQLKI